MNAVSVLVDTTYGPVEGFVNGEINTFLGIPFAKPPINELRFASPQEAESWTDTYLATGPTVPACIQNVDNGPPLESEDCLYINVYTPLDSESETTSYQVMIWIYGGGYDTGRSTSLLYDPSSMIGYIGDIIVVTFNYRLGILGFLYDNTYETGLSGNYGLEDQIMAIKWVYHNIANFGGDRDNINIFGESAGAVSVALHLLYNNEYIKSGIMQSPTMATQLREPDTWYDASYQFSKMVNCSTDLDGNELLQCWQSIDTDTILDAQSSDLMKNNFYGYKYSPTVRTQLFPNQPILEFQNGDIEIPPFIIGTNKDEAFSFFPDSWKHSVATYDFIFIVMTNYFGTDDAQNIFNYYNTTRISPNSEYYLYDMSRMLSDVWFCSIRNMLQDMDNTDNIYYYNFDVVNPVLNELVFWRSSPMCWQRTCHFTDIYYLFLVPTFTANMDNESIAIGEQMQIYWTNYAKQLNPNDANDNDYVWPLYTNDNDEDNFLDIEEFQMYLAKSTDEDRRDLCQFWKGIGYDFLGTYVEPTPQPTTEPTAGPTITPTTAETDNAFNAKPMIYVIMGGLVMTFKTII